MLFLTFGMFPLSSFISAMRQMLEKIQHSLAVLLITDLLSGRPKLWKAYAIVEDGA